MARDVRVKFVGDPTSFTRAVRESESSLDALAKKANVTEQAHHKLNSALIATTGGLISAGGLIEGLKKAVDAAENAQVANDLLAQQMKNVGLSFEANRKPIEEFIGKLSEMSGFTRTELTGAFTSLVRVTKDVGKAHEDLGIAVDLARLKHLSLEAATNLVTKAQIGMVGGLRRVGIDVQKVTTNMDALRAAHDAAAKAAAAHGEKIEGISRDQLAAAKAADTLATKTQALAKLHEVSAGAAEKYGHTAAGAMDRFKAAVEELEIKLGNRLLPTLSHVADKASSFIDDLDKSGTSANGLKLEVEDLAHKLETILGDINDVAGALGGWQTVLEGIAAIKLASMLSGWTGALGMFIGGGKGAGASGVIGAKTDAQALRAELAGLAATPAITIPITLAIALAVDEAVRGKHGLVSQAVAAGASAVGVGGDQTKLPTYDQWKKSKGSARSAIESIMHAAGITDPKQLPGGPQSGPTAGGGAGTKPPSYPDGTFNAPAGGVVATATAAAASPNAAAEAFHLPGERKPYDCSAFTQAVFKRNGISIGSTTYTQFASGRPVQRNDIQPGDLVFFNYPGERSPGHVGIATSSSSMVHDHGATRGVQSQGIDWSAFVGARCYDPSHVHTGSSTGGGGGGNTWSTTPKQAPPDIPAGVQHSIDASANKASNAAAQGQPRIAAGFLNQELGSLEKARAILKSKGKDTTEIDNKIRDVETAIKQTRTQIADDAFIKGLPGKLKIFTSKLAHEQNQYDALITKSQYDTGQALLDDYAQIAKNLGGQAETLQAEKKKLTSMLKGADKAQRAAIHDRINTVNQELSKVHDEAKQNLGNLASALQQSVSDISTKVANDFGTYKTAIDQAFEAATQQLVDAAGKQFFQGGALTPSEQKLADMHAADQKKAVYDPLSAAQKQLAKDTKDLNDALADQANFTDDQIQALKDQIQTDQDAIDQAQRAIDEYELEVQATAERTQADSDYAAAVKTITEERTAKEAELNAALDTFGGHLADGSANLSGLNPLLAAYGLTTGDVNAQSQLVSGSFKALSGDVNDLAGAMGRLQGVIDRITGSGAAAAAPDLVSEHGKGGGFPHFASGIENFAGGWALVGEHGPELAKLPGGSDVIPAGATAAALRRHSGVTVNINNPNFLSAGSREAKQLAELIRSELVKLGKNNGGGILGGLG